jgi:hypothetical protein
MEGKLDQTLTDHTPPHLAPEDLAHGLSELQRNLDHRKDNLMNENPSGNPTDATRIPASLQRKAKEPAKMVQFRIRFPGGKN